MASWRPLFVPRTLDQSVRAGPTTSSELPPPLEDAVQLPPLAAPRPAKVHSGPPVWTIALAAVLFAAAVAVLMRM
jgi:hypothetical protein